MRRIAITLNFLVLAVILFFVTTSGTESYDAIGYSALVLVLITPIVSLIALIKKPH